MKLKLHRPLAFFDLETTGLDVEKDRIVEIAICKVHPDGRREIFTTLVNPEIPIPEAASNVHGITNEKVADSPIWKEVGPVIFDTLKGCDIGGYNSNFFDVPFLYNMFNLIGLEWDHTKFQMIDVRNIFVRKEGRRLSDAVKTYLGYELENAHSAEADILATVDVFEAQLEKYNDLPSSLDGLALYSNHDKKVADLSGKLVYDEHGNLLFNFGKNAGKSVKSDHSYLTWMLSSNFPADTKKVIRDYLGIQPYY